MNDYTPLQKTICFTLVNFAFGLLPLWLIFNQEIFSFDFDKDEITKEGVIMFFCSAITMGLWFDYSITKVLHTNIIKRTIILIAPFLVVIISIISFLGLNYGSEVSKETYEKINFIQWLILIATFAYVLKVKFYLYKNE